MICDHVMWWVIYIVLLGVFVPNSHQQTSGSMIAPCIWQYDNTSVVNLNSIGNTDGTARWVNMPTIAEEQDPNLYSLNPCHAFNGEGECQGVTACRTSNLGHSVDIGDPSPVSMYFSLSDNTLVLEYVHSENTSTRMVSRFLTLCSGDPDDQVIVNGVTSSTPTVITHTFHLVSKCSCANGCPDVLGPTIGVPTSNSLPATVTLRPINTSPRIPGTVTLKPINTSPMTRPPTVSIIPIPSGGSKQLTAGGIMCILFTCGVCAYFLIGSAYMFVFRGAKGIEIIPNVHFWLDLPRLISDGLVFLCSCGGQTKVVAASPGEYDKI